MGAIYDTVASSAVSPLIPSPYPGKTRYPPNKVLLIRLENRAQSGKPVANDIQYNRDICIRKILTPIFDIKSTQLGYDIVFFLLVHGLGISFQYHRLLSH